MHWFFSSMLLATVGACSSVTRVEAPHLDPERVPALTGPSIPKFTNGYPAKTLVPMASAGVYSYEADLKQWTEAGIAALQAELERQGGKPAARSAPPIEIKVSRTSSQSTVMGVKVHVWIQAKRGSDAAIEAKGGDWHGKWPRACEGALAAALQALLNDAHFRAYLASS